MPAAWTENHLYTHETGQVFGTGLEARRHVGRMPVYAPATASFRDPIGPD